MRPQHEGWLAWHSVARLACLIDRQQSAISWRDFIRGLLVWAQVAQTGTPDAVAGLDLPMPGFEDALQAAAANAYGAQVIVTRNERDFKGSPVPAMTPGLGITDNRP